MQLLRTPLCISLSSLLISTALFTSIRHLCFLLYILTPPVKSVCSQSSQCCNHFLTSSLSSCIFLHLCASASSVSFHHSSFTLPLPPALHFRFLPLMTTSPCDSSIFQLSFSTAHLSSFFLSHKSHFLSISLFAALLICTSINAIKQHHLHTSASLEHVATN